MVLMVLTIMVVVLVYNRYGIGSWVVIVGVNGSGSD